MGTRQAPDDVREDAVVRDDHAKRQAMRNLRASLHSLDPDERADLRAALNQADEDLKPPPPPAPFAEGRLLDWRFPPSGVDVRLRGHGTFVVIFNPDSHWRRPSPHAARVVWEHAFNTKPGEVEDASLPLTSITASGDVRFLLRADPGGWSPVGEITAGSFQEGETIDT